MEVLIEDRIHKTRRQVKGIDIAAGFLTLITGSLAYLFIAALIDHWLITGGLGFWGRFITWAILILACAFYFVKHLWPALVLRINPVFAAQTIEQCKPTLKNSLINFLLLRGRQNEMAPVIYDALEQRAAADLKEVKIETAVDRRPVLQLSYVLLAVIGVICLYLALSPKNPLISAARVLWPWSSVRAPTRVTIDNVQPGNAVAFHGDFVPISAEVRGLNKDETVLLHYSTANGEIVDQAVPMAQQGGPFRYQTKLPPDDLGLQQDYSYFIAAGDFRTAAYTIQTQIAPVITVDKLDYHYPPYTGILDNMIQRQGDVRAIEGTQVTVHATASQLIQRADIDFTGAGMRGIRMNVDDRSATGRLTLRMRSDDPTRPEHDFYQIRMTDKNGRENRRPIRYNIEVLRDLPPEVQIVYPQQDETTVAQDGILEIRIRAADPDFGLNRATIHAELEKQSLDIPPLLDNRPPEKPVSGEFQGKFLFEPKKFNLKPGDRVEYWAEAEDNKVPSPNVTATGKQWIVIVEPENPQANNQQPHPAQRPGQQPDNNSPNPQSPDKQPNAQPQENQKPNDQTQSQNQSENKPDEKGENKNEQGDKGEKGENGAKGEKGDSGDKGEKSMKGEKGREGDKSKQQNQSNNQQTSGDQSKSGQQGQSSQSGKPGDNSSESGSGKNQNQSAGQQANQKQEPIDPNANPGDAFQEILDHRQQEQQKEKQNTQTTQQQQNNQQQSGDKQAQNQPSGNQQQAAGNQAAGNQQPNEKQSGEKQSTADKQLSGVKQPGDNQAQNQPSKKQQMPGENQPGEKKSGEKQPSDDAQLSGTKQGEKQPSTGEKPTGENQLTDKQQKPDAAQTSEKLQPGPEAQEPNQPRTKQPGQPGQEQNKKPEEGQSPGTSPKPSDTKGETSGDHSAEGQPSGRQQTPKPGAGTEGSQKPADQSGSKSDEQGKGELGKKPGDQTQPGQPTGSETKQQPGQDSQGQKQPGGEKGSDSQLQKPSDSSAAEGEQKPSDNNQPGKLAGQKPSTSGTGNSMPGGGQQGTNSEAANPPEAQESGADAANLDYSRKQTELALEHLEDQLDKNQPELLERLGWTPEQAQRFIDRWQQLRRAADEKGPRGEEAKKQFDDALKSLGLRPGTTYLKHGDTKIDQIPDLRDSGRFAPPPDWAEQFRQYTRGVANQGKENSGQETSDNAKK